MQYPELNCVVSVSGFRGVVGTTIDATTVAAIAACYGVEIAQRGTVILGKIVAPLGIICGSRRRCPAQRGV